MFFYEQVLSERHLLIFLLQVCLLLGLARCCGELLRHWGQPALVGEILVGVLLGPTVLGHLAPGLQHTLFPPDRLQYVMLETVAWLGILFLLFEAGLEVDVSAAWRQRGPALRIGIIGVLVPLVLGAMCSFLLPDRYLADPTQRLIFALFMGTAMAISAMAVIARVLHDLDLLKSDLGLLTLCGYAVNDILALVIFSLILALATQGSLALGAVALLLFVALAFPTVCLTLGRRVVGRTIAFLHTEAPQQQGLMLTFLGCLGVLCGGLTQWLGLHALFGFFLAGIMAGEAPRLPEKTRQIFSDMIHAVLVPLYFAGIGLRFDFLSHFDLLLVVFVTSVAIVSKFFGAWLGTFGSSLSKYDRLSVGIAFTPSGMTEIIIAKIALEHQMITLAVFVAMVCSALISSLLVGPGLVWSIRRRPRAHILEFFLQSAIVPQLQGHTQTEVIQELCQALASGDPRLDAKTLAVAVRTREELMGTGIGYGIAIPHSRVAGLAKPVLTVGRSLFGVEWDSPDGIPVQLVFLLLTPTQDDSLQLQTIATLARALSSETVRHRLTHAATEQQIWHVLQDVLGSQSFEHRQADEHAA